MDDENTYSKILEGLTVDFHKMLMRQPKVYHHVQSSHARKKQLRKARYWRLRYEAEKFYRVQVTECIENLIRSAEIPVCNPRCEIKRVTPDGSVYFDVSVEDISSYPTKLQSLIEGGNGRG